MKRTMKKTQMVVVGSGPAGLSAAVKAAGYGVEVMLVDEHARPGGQLFKQIHKFFGSHTHYAGMRGPDIGRLLLKQAETHGVSINLETTVWGIFQDRVLGLVRGDRTERIQADKIILATGAMENALRFPGWTLPGVMGAGAVQTMVNLNRVLPGKRFLMVGSGNVGLIVSYHLLQAGGHVVKLVEALPRISGWGVHASKLARCGVPIEVSKTIKRVCGRGRVEYVDLISVDEAWNEIPGTEQRVEVDVVCIAVGLNPLSELAWIAGCGHKFVPELGGWIPRHDESLQTMVPGIYVAGDVTGIDEASTAMEEGRIAGISAAEALGCLDKRIADAERGKAYAQLAEFHQSPWGVALAAAQRKMRTGEQDGA